MPEAGPLSQAPPPAPVVTPPTGPSAASPPGQAGLKAQARVKMTQGTKMLIEALAILKEVSSDEGKALIAALKVLGPVVPDVAEGLGQSEIASMMSGAQAVRPAGPPGTMLGTPRPSPTVMAGPRQMGGSAMPGMGR